MHRTDGVPGWLDGTAPSIAGLVQRAGPTARQWRTVPSLTIRQPSYNDLESV